MNDLLWCCIITVLLAALLLFLCLVIYTYDARYKRCMKTCTQFKSAK